MVLNHHLSDHRATVSAGNLQPVGKHSDVFADQFQSTVDHITLISVFPGLVPFPVCDRFGRRCPFGVRNQPIKYPLRIHFGLPRPLVLGCFNGFGNLTISYEVAPGLLRS